MKKTDFLQKRIQALQDDCWDLMLQDPDSAMTLAIKSLELAKNTDLVELQGRGLFMQGWCHSYAGRYPQAPEYFQKSIAEFMKIQDVSQIARSYNGMGWAFQSLGQFGVSLQHYETSLSMLEQVEENSIYFATKINMALLHCSEGDWAAAKAMITELDAQDLSSFSNELKADYYYVKAWSMLQDEQEKNPDQYISLAEEYALKVNFTQLLFHIGILRVQYLKVRGETQQAISGLLELIDFPTFDQQGVDRYVVLTLLANLYFKSNQLDLADQTFRRAFLLDKNPWPHQFLFDLHQAYSLFLASQDNYTAAYEQSQTALNMQQLLFAKQMASTESNRVVAKEIARLKREDLIKEMNIKSLQLLHQKTQLINRIGHQLASTFDIGAIGLRLYDVVHREFDVHFISIAEYVPDRQLFKFEILVEEGVVLPAIDRPLNTPGMQAAKVVENGKKVILNSDFKPTIESLTSPDTVLPQSGIFLPLTVENELIGVWSLQSQIKNRFKDEDIELMESITPFVSIAFNNALSHRRLDSLNKEIAFEKESVVEAHKKVEYQALHDGLTGLPNRRQLTSVANQRIRGARQHDRNFHLLYIDLNGFKLVNDQHGHKVGDQVLKKMAVRLQKNFRDSDIIARVGGDEFVAVISKFSDSTQLLKFLEKLKESITKTIWIDDKKFILGSSVGVASFPEDGANLDQLIQVADANMYLDKTGKS